MGLLTYEQKLDSLISRKKMEIQEALKRPLKIKRKLRIYVSHSFVPGKEPEVSFGNFILFLENYFLEGNRRRCYSDVGIAGGRSTLGRSTTTTAAADCNFKSTKFTSTTSNADATKTQIQLIF